MANPITDNPITNGLIKRVRYKRKKPNVTAVGETPGTVMIADDAVAPLITVYSYNEHEVVEDQGKDIHVVLEQFKKCKNHTHWIQIQGLASTQLFEELEEHLHIDPLVLEDISNTHQRPKFDEYEDYVFSVSRTIHFNENYELINNQFSALVTRHTLITFEETHGDSFEAVKARLKAGKGIIRTGGPGYMCYALNDMILDLYFVLLAQVGDSLDEVEDRLYKNADKSIMYDAQQLKRTLIIVRRAIWPERDKINDMIRTESPLFNSTVKMYLRDAYDHCIQIMDIIENDKEITSSIIDLYLSMVSNRMNEIMKVLTIISVIFIPLTFIAGIYGMNFSRTDPVTNKVMPANMPELYSPHGYVYALLGMLAIALVQVVVFWKKGWFTRL
jgi:magnesium transporter